MSDQPQRTRSQRFSESALKAVEAVAKNTAMRDDYKSRADGFPVMVMQSGLAQAVGFLRGKSEGRDDNAYGRYLKDLGGLLGQPEPSRFQSQVIKAELPEYRRLTRDALDASSWIKRFCQTLVKNAADATKEKP